MHDRTDSGDSALVIRTNPLNIRGLDGGDLVIDENALRQQVSVFKPQLDVSPHRSPERAVIVGDAVEKAQSVSPLLIKKNPVLEVPTVPADHEFTVSDLDIPTPKLELDSDLGLSLANELSNVALSRKNTISSKTKGATVGPSQTPDLVQRLRSVRRKLAVDGLENLQDADDADDILPAGMLKALSFSPNFQWLPSDDEDSAGEEEEKEVSPWVASRESTVEPSTPVETHQGEVTTDPLEADEELFIPELKEEPVVPQLRRRDPIADSDRPLIESSEETEPVTTPNLSDADPVDCNDRGRLFLQINKLSGLKDLPFDGGRNPRFTLTLDNGLQTVTTPPVPLTAPGFSGIMSAKIGQEFELLVGMDLELVITMSVYMDALEAPLRPRRDLKPEAQKVETPPPSPKKSGGLRGFLSPKKKRLSVDKLPPTIDQQSYLRDEREHDLAMESFKRRSNLWKGVTGPNGEAARGYLFESHYEADIYGHPQSYSLPLYNEWQGEDPKQMCDLQVTLMYVPKLFNSETLPSSMQACVKELETARHNRSLKFEGFLTQNGGDCALWRRRWFTLRRNELVGHHEDTKKVRSFIRMENARSILDAAEVPPSDDLWCIYEDRTFFVTFKDGEELSFYADTAELKDQWLHALRMAATYCTTQQKTWKDLVLDEEEKVAA